MILIFSMMALFIWILGSIIFWTLRNGISPMPSSLKVKRVLMKNLPVNIEGVIYELGSGWGTLAFALAKKYPKAQVIGLETSFIPFWVSKGLALCLHIPNLQLKRRSFFDIPLNDASLIVCYLYPKAMQRLKPKFERELPLETLVVSNTFSIPGWKSVDTYLIHDLYKTRLYFYKSKSAIR